ncbi:proton myo-inositol cotransporter-like, partial [Physella acuta]|uniref:proton myo-inositol cotransporter-like n=1 Tax=Physella acuta TaxID=109671 RepID=UPI0027DC6B66
MNSGKAETETSNDKYHIFMESVHGVTIPGKKDNSQEEGDYANEEDDNAVESNAIAESVVEDSQVIDREERSKSHPCVIYWLATCATVSGLLFGYDTGIISGSLLLINEQYGLSSYYQVAIVSSTVVSAAVFSLVSGMVADAIGRKLTIMISAVVFTVGGVIMGFATGPEMILIGRIVVGASIGFVSSIVPVYVSECAPPDIRGRLLTLNQLFITIGIVVSSVMAGALQNIKPSGWRYMLGLAAIPGIVQFIFFFYLPESPRYQMMKNQEREAEITLKKIRNTNNVDQEMDEIRQSLKQEAESKGWHIWKQIFTTPHVRKALFIGCMLQVFQQFCGINTVIYYSGSILLSAGFSTEMAIWLACVPAVFNFLATFIGLWAVESLGRKLVLTLSFLAIAVALCVLCFGFAMSLAESPGAN